MGCSVIIIDLPVWGIVLVTTIETITKIAQGLCVPIESLIIPLKEKTTDKGAHALRDLTAYLSTRTSEDIVLVHEIAVKIFERRKNKA